MARSRMTLLEIVNRCLDAMNHNTVNTISSTPESRKIAKEARITYYDLMDRDDWPHLMVLQPLEAVIDTTRPNFLKIPEEVVRIDDIRYESTKSQDTTRSFKQIQYCLPVDFLNLTFSRREENDNVIVVPNHNQVDMFILNDQAPTYWTTFDDEYLIFDSYDAEVDSTLQQSKSLMQGKSIPTWTSSDSFIPDMPEQMFSVYIAEVTAAAFTYWKQGASPKDEQRAARGISRLRKDARKHNEQQYGRPDYGRKRYGWSYYIDGDKGSARDASFGAGY